MHTLLSLFSLILFSSSQELPWDTLKNGEKDPRQITTSPHPRSRETILEYFDHLIANHRIIAGQQCGNSLDQTNAFYQKYVGRLAGKTNRYVGLISADLGAWSNADPPIHTLVDHWQEGGLVSLSWYAANPFAEGDEGHYNSIEGKEVINLRALLKGAGESKMKSKYRDQVDRMARVLQRLQSQEVIVIWRPFPKMNTHFFWWGMDAYNNLHTNRDDFLALWKDLYNTLTYDYGLKNLLWVYSVTADLGWNARPTAYYPGSDYVDLVGLDFRGSTPAFPDYPELRSLGKTLVVSEANPEQDGKGSWDALELIRTLKGKAAYFIQGSPMGGSGAAIIHNRKVNDMMNSESVVSRDEMREDFLNQLE